MVKADITKTTVALMTAISTPSEQYTVYVTGISKGYRFFQGASAGDYEADDDTGWWCFDYIIQDAASDIWIIECITESLYYCVIQEDTPTECPVNSEHTVGDIFKDIPYIEPFSRDGTKWCLIIDNDGTMIAAKAYP